MIETVSRGVVVLAALSACGRFDFSARPATGDAPGDAPSDGTSGDSAHADAAVPRTAPPAGHVLSLPGDGYFVADALCAAMTSSQAMTVNAWVYPAVTQPAGNPSVASFNTGDGGANLALMQWTSARFNYYDDQATGYTYTGLMTAPGVWHYASFVVDAAGSGAVYEDGVLEETFTTPRQIASSSRFSLGQEWDGNATSDFFAGYVDELTVWSVARTQAEVIDEMSYGPVVGTAGLVAYYPFESGGSDASAHGYAGTLAATATIEVTP